MYCFNIFHWPESSTNCLTSSQNGQWISCLVLVFDTTVMKNTNIPREFMVFDFLILFHGQVGFYQDVAPKWILATITIKDCLWISFLVTLIFSIMLVAVVKYSEISGNTALYAKSMWSFEAGRLIKEVQYFYFKEKIGGKIVSFP